MSTARFFVSGFALGVTALLWLTGNPRALAQQNAPPAQTPDQSTVLPLDGAKIFRNYCASCHGVNGNGNGPVAPALKTKIPRLTTLARRNHGQFPAAHVHSIIAGDQVRASHGSPEMPVWGPIFQYLENYNEATVRRRIKNLCDFLESIQEK